MYDDEKYIVIDLGSKFIKIGEAHDKIPKFSFPSIVGRYKSRSKAIFGLRAIKEQNSNDIVISYPIVRGHLQDKPNIKALINYRVYLKINCSDRDE